MESPILRSMENRFQFGEKFENFQFVDPSASEQWLEVIQTFPQWFETQNIDQIRQVLSRDLREMPSVSLGWSDDHVLRFVSADRRLVRLILGRSDDFVLTELCPDVDSQQIEDWKSIRAEKMAADFIKKIYRVTMRLAEKTTTSAEAALARSAA